MITSNIIAMMAARRAVTTYLRMLKTGQVQWDKTEHSFPQGPLR
jgi:adsorption protein B